MEYQPEEYDEYVDDNDIYDDDDDDDDVNNLYKFIHSNTEEAEDLPENIRNALKTFSKGKQLRD